jgi:hypothetical protein
MRSNDRGGWILGLVLIALGAIFLLQNAGLPVLVGNWWALFILIPAVAAFGAAWRVYQQAGRLTPEAMGLVTGGLVPLTVALIFLLNFDFGAAWPVLLLVIGAGMLLRSVGSTENANNQRRRLPERDFRAYAPAARGQQVVRRSGRRQGLYGPSALTAAVWNDVSTSVDRSTGSFTWPESR